MSEQLYRVTAGAACFGVVVEEGVVTRAAPIAGKIAGEAWVAVRGRYRQVEEVRDRRSIWMRDRRTKAIVGYKTPDGQLVRIANAGELYARYLRMLREQEERC